MRHVIVVLLALTLLSPALQAQPASPAPASAPAPGPVQKALAEALLLDAQLDHVPDRNLLLQARRSSVLAQLALQQDPGLTDAYRLISEVAQATGELGDAALSDAYLLGLAQGDYQVARRWLRYNLASLPTAEARQRLLLQVANQEKFPAAFRALAVENLGALAEAQGRPGDARTLYLKALELEPTSASALVGLARLEAPLSPARQAELNLALLRGDPNHLTTILELANLARAVGLYERALGLYDHAEAVAAVTAQTLGPVYRMARAEALLDADQPRRVLELYAEALSARPEQLALAALVVEAHRRLGQDEPAAELAESMGRVVKGGSTAGDAPAGLASQLAWFYLTIQRDPARAREWAGLARQQAPDAPAVARVWALAMLETDQAPQARAILEPLAPSDPQALGALARWAYAAGHDAGGARYLALATDLPRTGAGWRAIRDLAAEQNVPIPPLPEAQAVAERLDGLDEAVLAMGRAPQQFLSVELVPQARSVQPGEPLAVEVVLTNPGPSAVPLGEPGLVMPQGLLTVRAELGEASAEQIVPLVLPAPRWLQPGQSLRHRVRLERSAVGDLLALHPLETVRVSARFMLDPVERAGELVPTLEPVGAEPVTIERQPLIAQPEPQAYYRALAGLVRRFRGPDTLDAMQAAEVTVSLLRTAQTAQAGNVAVPADLDLLEPQLLAMLQYLLQQSPPAVRAQTLGAMVDLELTPLMLELLKPVTTHESPLVRARAIELLARSGDRRQMSVIRYLGGKDPNTLVKDMAALMQAMGE